ncbi:RHS repeat domain-containing protein [Leifsonia sp. NPDC058292]|uniref:RHS repeat domain-containing protein n=1 Tax=Leifsonia sp. NPDC058292 TaxID=3346428 RepID=UPI0036DCE74E
MTDRVHASVDVGTGNLLVSTDGIDLPGISGSVPIGATYNSMNSSTGSTSTIYANSWSYGFGGAGSLSSGLSGGVVYTAGDGGTWLFTPVSGSTTAFTAPAGLKADLVKNTSTYTLTQRDTRRVVTFDLNGNALSVADRNAAATTLCYVLTPSCNASGSPYTTPPLSIVSPAGAGTAPTASLSYSTGYTTLTITQANGSSSRNVQYVKDANSNLTGFLDATGKLTTFGYTSSKLTKITSPTGAVTNFSYDSNGRIQQVDQLNTSAGSPGTSTTRLAYPLGTQTLVAGPNTSTSSGVSAVPHLVYTIDATQRVTKVIDEQNRQRAKTYTPNFDTLTATNGTGTTAGTTTGVYGANSNQSLTKVTSPGGAADQAAYGNASPATQYLPSTTTDDAGRQTTLTYDGPGNPQTVAQGIPTATATLTHNSDGTVATALGAGNGSNTTSYGYTSHQLTTITPVTVPGTPLGNRTITYDDFGRIKTATDGKSTPVTTTYGYDKNDRLTSTTFSDSTHSTVNTYDDAGKLKTSVDGSGTITNGYDQLERLTSTVNTAGGGTITYGYDKASNLISTTDGFGTTTNTYDTSNVLLNTKYPHSGSFQYLYYTTDDQGRRTDSYLQSDATKVYWLGHTHYEYDPSGRITRVTAETEAGALPANRATVFDTSYCYNAGSAAPTCSTTTTSDRSQLQWSKDNLTGGLTTTYTYDGSGRIKTVTQTGTGANTWNYTYDARGNRLTAVVTGAAPSSQTLTYNAANQITSTGYTYDGAGNLTAAPGATYTYNGAQQMTQAVTGTVTSTYTYAGTSQNQVLSESFSGRTYQLTYGRTDKNGQPVIEGYNVNGNQAYLFSDPKTGQPTMLSTSSDQDCLYVIDGIGNPVGLLTDFATNAFTFAYDPYGAANLTAGGTGNGAAQNPYLFKAGIQDRATGLVKFGQRWYNPTTGTWTQQDTLDTPLDPANANRYAFAGSDPINGSDPTGRSCSGAIVGASASVFVEALAGVAVIAGSPSLVLGAAAAAGFAVGAGLTVAAVGDAVEECN